LLADRLLEAVETHKCPIAFSRRMLQRQIDGVEAMARSVELDYLGTAVAAAGGTAVHDLQTNNIPNWIPGPGIVHGTMSHLDSFYLTGGTQ